MQRWKMKIGLIGAAMLAVLLSGARQAEAVILWDFELLNPVQNVGPTQTVLLDARLTNLSTSTEPITKDNIASQLFSAVPTIPPFSFVYEIRFSPPGESSTAKFDGLDLDPGEHFDFVFAFITPNSGPAPVGFTATGGATLSLIPKESVDPSFILRPYSLIVVDQPASEPVVPEPSSFFFLGSGLLGLAGWRRRR